MSEPIVLGLEDETRMCDHCHAEGTHVTFQMAEVSGEFALCKDCAVTLAVGAFHDVHCEACGLGSRGYVVCGGCYGVAEEAVNARGG